MNAQSLSELQAVNSFAALPEAFYTRLAPRGLNNPRLLHANEQAAALIGLDPSVLTTPEFLQVFSGGQPLPGGDTLAAVYSGHQFGVWAGQLGDGRAHLLGEVQGPEGAWELQLKGSGMTPYSRMGDGRAVLRSSVREYLASEAMFGLGVPTTRALALVVSDDPVMRETVETAAIVTRMSPSFVRFGSFEHWSSRRQPDMLKTLADYVIDRYYPECRDVPTGDSASETAPYVNLLREVTRRTALLMADWQAVGFCHGVMNTDNMSILGLTLDYGPYGFMDGFRLGHICNHSDAEGRYSWNRQPSVGLWNLYRLGGSLHLLVQDADALRAVLDEYEAIFTRAFHDKMAAKMGLAAWRPDDEALLDDLLKLMDANQADFTLSWRRLADATQGQRSAFEDLFIDRPAAGAWLDKLLARHAQDGRPAADTAAAMNGVNPLYVLRNHLAEQAIRAAKAGDASEIETLMKLLRSPFVAQEGFERYAGLPPDWAGGIEVSCSS
ncbi:MULTISPECIES: YdiU family protein [Achromobacter]|uniref:protein adenylyltransferase SelO n=1 Tax=Achromobacter TaxID=222 RepID=UPI001EF350CA|nr:MULTISPECIES: YdiU family protein [Achromobacter]MCG7327051.1 YdiU family protein [Achromobacter sp. ACRQX]MDH0684507.1 YdiU family protein [Achromobacter animicus]